MAASEAYPFSHQTVEVGGLHIVKPQFSNRIKSLLVGNDKDNIWAFLSHGARTVDKGAAFFTTLSNHYHTAGKTKAKVG